MGGIVCSHGFLGNNGFPPDLLLLLAMTDGIAEWFIYVGIVATLTKGITNQIRRRARRLVRELFPVTK